MVDEVVLDAAADGRQPIRRIPVQFPQPQIVRGKIAARLVRRGADGRLTAVATITNTGSREATTIVQLYSHDLAASITRPVQELKGFQHVTLAPGQSQEVTFNVTPEMLKFYNAKLEYVNEPGDFDLMIGLNCREVKHAGFTLVK